jgi:hypothetical protein
MSLLLLLKHAEGSAIEPEGVGEETRLWEVLYDAMGFHRETDEATGYQLKLLCQVSMSALQRVYDLVREQEGRAAGATMLDPDNVAAEGLDYLAQYVGGKLLPIMSEQQKREEIKRPSTWRRGEVETIKLIVRRTLTGDEPLVIVRPRTPEVGRIYIRTLSAETPNPALVERELLESGIPAWDVLDYAAVAGLSYADLEASKYQTYGELEASPIQTYQALEEALPGDL